MNSHAATDGFGRLTEPATLTVRRRLPGPIERVWAYLTDGDLRRQWFAAGDMILEPDAPLQLVWRNDELTSPPGHRADGPSGEHRMDSRVLRVDPPHALVITWGASGEVAFELAAEGDDVLLTLTHRRLPGRPGLLNIAAGWHAHLDVLEARLARRAPEAFWDGVARLKAEYDRRLPA